MAHAQIDQIDIGDLQFCQAHSGKEITYFCEDDQMLCCPACVISNHSKCKTMTKLTTLGRDLKEAGRAQQLQTRLHDLQTQLGEVKETLDENTSEIAQQADDIPKQMAEAENKITKMLDKRTTKVTSQCKKLAHHHLSEIEESFRNIRCLEELIYLSASSLDSLIKHGTETQTFILVRKLEEEIRQYEEKLKDIYKNTKFPDLQLILSDDFKKILKSSRSLTANVTTDFKQMKPYKVPTSECVMRKPSVVEIPQYGSFSLSKFCGSGHLSNGQLVTIDCTNYQCCLMDNSFTVIAHIKLPSEPSDVAVMGRTEVVVCLPDLKRLQRVRVEGTKLKLIGSIRCWRVPRTVSRVSDTEFAVGYDKGLEIMSLGRMEKSYLSTTKKGEYIRFSSADRMVVDAKRRRIFLSRFNKDTVECLSYSGKVCFSYSHGLKFPSSLALDRDHNLYICSQGSDRIHQVSPDGQLIKEIDPGISFPSSVCFNAAGDKMTVMNCIWWSPKPSSGSKIRVPPRDLNLGQPHANPVPNQTACKSSTKPLSQRVNSLIQLSGIGLYG